MLHLNVTGTLQDLEPIPNGIRFSLDHITGNGTKKKSTFQVLADARVAKWAEDNALADGDMVQVTVYRLQDQQCPDPDDATKTLYWLLMHASDVIRIDDETPHHADGMVVCNVGKDAEMNFTPSGTPYTKYSVAINWREKQADGTYKKVPHWADCTIWGRKGAATDPKVEKDAASIASEYVVKGSLVTQQITGIHYVLFARKDGSMGTRTELTVRNPELLGRPKDAAVEVSGARPPGAARRSQPTAPVAPEVTITVPPDEEEVPF